MTRTHVAVVGGAVAGLAAAERLSPDVDVTLFERATYADKRVNCGEAINAASLVPLEKTRENGFHNDVDAFDLTVYPSTDHDPDDRPVGEASFPCADGYIVDRNVVERRWAARLADRGVTVEEGANVTKTRFEELAVEFDYVVDATGQPALTTKVTGDTDAYTGEFVALNADVAGDYADYYHRPKIVFEGYTGYFWVFPKTPERANVGIGWPTAQRPDDYMTALSEACERNGVPVPDRGATNVYTIPEGPSLDPARAYRPDRNALLVGDAAGLANRYQGEGIAQAIRSAYLAADMITASTPEEYPDRLYRLMRPEFRLANLMRGAWDEHEDPALLGAVVEAIDGLDVDGITRNPRRVIARVARHPGLTARLLAKPGMLRRLYRTYTDRWEYRNRPTAG